MSDITPTPDPDPFPASVDTSVAHSARVWNYWLGGKDNYPADREVGDQVREVFPAIVDEARHQRAFLRRAVTYLAGEAGVRQFLDIGTGMPTHYNTHQVAQAVAPEARVVYVDNDPLVLAHAEALLVGSPQGMTDYIHADLREPATIIHEARQRLDFTQPIALMLSGILAHLPDEQAHSVAHQLREALPGGSYLCLCDGTDTDPTYNEATRRYNETAPLPYRLRSPEQIAAFFQGLDVIAPGIVPSPQWRPEPSDIGAVRESNSRAGVGRKPSKPTT